MRDPIQSERVVFEIAVRHPVFSLGEIWDEARFYRYGWISKTLLRWWKDDGLTERYGKDGKWHEGFPWTAGHDKLWRGVPAIYRWKE